MAGKKLLVADDSLTIQKVIRLALSNEGYEIQAVSDGVDAVQQISLIRPDVVLIDVSLPGKTAFEVKREINGLDDLAETRFVLMSSAFEQVDEGQAEEVRFHGRLTKPFDPANLRQVLQDVLAQVAAKRMEATSLISRPNLTATPAPPQTAETVSIFPPLSAMRGSSESDAPTVPPPDFAPPAPAAEEWNQPLQPEEPVISPPVQESASTLWEAGEMQQQIQAPPPVAQPVMDTPTETAAALESAPIAQPVDPQSTPAPTDSEPHHDADIRSLTESTIRISGLEDYQWSVQEPKLRPPAGMLEKTELSFKIDPPLAEGQGPTPPFVPQIAEARGAAPQIPQPQEHTEISNGPVYSAAAEPSSEFEEVPSASIPADQLELIVREQVQSVLEKMASQMLPDLAERIIKQEIHRMLSESP